MSYSNHLKIRKTAEQLNFTDLPKIVLYGQPKSRSYRRSGFDKAMGFFGTSTHTAGSDTDTVGIISGLLHRGYNLKSLKLKFLKDPYRYPGYFLGYGYRRRTHRHYFLVPSLNLYIELDNKTKRLAGLGMKKWAFQLSIYSLDKALVISIVNAINANYKGGFLNRINNWPTIEKYFGVNSQDCIKTWNSFINLTH